MGGAFHLIIYLIVFVIWVIQAIVRAAASAKKSREINQARRTPPVQPVRTVPQQFSAPIQNTPTYTGGQPQAQYGAVQQLPQPQYRQPPLAEYQPTAPYQQPQYGAVQQAPQYAAYPPAAQTPYGYAPPQNQQAYGYPGQAPPQYAQPAIQPYGNPAQSVFGQGQAGPEQFGRGQYAQEPASPYGAGNQAANSRYGQSQQIAAPVYGQPQNQPPAYAPSSANRNVASPSAQRAQRVRAVASGSDATASAPSDKGSKSRQGAVSGLFTSKNAVVRAVILQEVLGPPKSRR